MAECNQIGKMIRYEREKGGISMETLCRGLCSRSFLVRVEKGERACEKILADALLQRAGVSADKFFYIMNPEEQDWLLINEELIACIEAGDSIRANSFMEAYEKLTAKGSKLHKQQLLLYQVVLEWKVETPAPYMLDKLKEAWEISMSGISMENMENIRLTLTEIILIMMYNRILEDMGYGNEASDGYEYLLHYLNEFTDEEDRVKLFPQIAYRQSLWYIGNGETLKAAKLAEKSVALLKVRCRLFYLRQFLDILVEFGNLNQGTKTYYQELSQTLKWVYQNYQVDDTKWIWNIPFCMTEVELCGDFIRNRREALGLSQEELAEGICSPVSLSRIECGKVAPQKLIFQKLMQKINMTGNEFISVVHVENTELLELAVEIAICLSHSNGEAAEPLIMKLESQMQNPDRFANQFLQYAKAHAWYEQNKIDAATHHALQMEALHLTLPQLEQERLKKWNFSSQESSIINALSYSCDKVHKGDEIIVLLELLLNQYENKPFSLLHYIAGYELTARNLGNMLGNQGRLQDAIHAADKAIQAGLMAGRGAILNVALYDRGWDMEQLWDEKIYAKEESLSYIKAALHLNRFMSGDRYKDFFVEHIKRVYEES